MGYAIGIDLGTTFTAAAVAETDRAPQMLSLGASGYSIPSVLFLHEDGRFLAGEAAELRAAGDPTRVARHFKRRLGDEVPIRLNGQAYRAEELTAELLRWVVDLATSRQGEPPEVVVLTHPANWREYRTGLLEQVADEVTERVPGTDVVLLSEPAAAAMHYVQGERVESGAMIGVYDLGGGTFDAAVMRRTAEGFESMGRAGGLDRLGGIDFDDTIWSFVLEAAEVDLGADGPDTRSGAFDLRSNCRAAKHLLSVDTAADIRVTLPARSRTVRLNRAEFERRIRPGLESTLDAFAEVLTSAGIEAEDLHRILLVGGSSRIPLVSALLTQRFGVPVAVDSDPKNAIALGAAGWGLTSMPAPVHEPGPSIVSHLSVDENWPAPEVEALGARRIPSVPPPNPPARPPLPPRHRAEESTPLAGVATESTLRQRRARVATRPVTAPAFETVAGQAEPVRRSGVALLIVGLALAAALAVVAAVVLTR